VRDSRRSLTYAQWHARKNRLANALLGLGLAKGDRVALLAYNCVEWMEIYAALAARVWWRCRSTSASPRPRSPTSCSTRGPRGDRAGRAARRGRRLRGELPVGAGRLGPLRPRALPRAGSDYEALIAAASEAARRDGAARATCSR
jgi:fatty-acyl-CoA synthase